jgi:hypothetical protein
VRHKIAYSTIPEKIDFNFLRKVQRALQQEYFQISTKKGHCPELKKQPIAKLGKDNNKIDRKVGNKS